MITYRRSFSGRTLYRSVSFEDDGVYMSCLVSSVFSQQVMMGELIIRLALQKPI